MLHESMGNMEAALTDYRRAVEAQPDHGQARLRLAEALLKHQQYDKAATQFERLLHGGLRKPAVLLGLARCRLQQGRREDARHLLDDLLAAFPDDGNALRERGKLALAQEELATAENLLRRAVAAQPYDLEAVYKLSDCLRRRGRTKEADDYRQRVKQMETDLRQMEKLYPLTVRHPEDPGAAAGTRSDSRLRNHRDDEARRWLNSVLQLDPHHRQAHRAPGGTLPPSRRHGEDSRTPPSGWRCLP